MEHNHLQKSLPQGLIAELAYEMYQIDGKPEGHELKHWLEAERVLLGRQLLQQPKETAEAASPDDDTVCVVVPAKDVQAGTRRKARPRSR